MTTQVSQSRSPRVRTLIAFSALIMLVFCIVVAYQASRAYTDALGEGEANAERLVDILADQAELSFLSVDLTLRRASERHYFNQLFGGTVANDLGNNFKLWVDETPQIAALMLVNATGEIEVAATKKGYEGWFDYASPLDETPLFVSMQTEPETRLYIGRYSALNTEDRNLIFMARRVDTLDGVFGGVMIAAIDAQVFVQFLKSIDLSDQRFLALMLGSGNVLHAGPEDSMLDEETMLYWLGARVRGFPHHDELSEQAELYTETINGRIKVIAIRHLTGLPVYLSIVVDEDNFLANWREARIKDITFLAIFTIFGSVLSFFALTMAKQIVRVEESESAAIMASQAKSEFLANMSHELRTPLNAIIGFSEMMQAGYFGELNTKQNERVRDIHLCGSHLLQLITDILEFSKGEAGRLELHEEEFALQEIAEECVRMLNEKAKAKMIDIEVVAEGSLPELNADKRKIRQILINLLSNAIKFTPEYGKVTVSIIHDINGGLSLRVVDTGVGIPEEQIPTALAVFGQVHRGQSHEGTGLGLPLCKMFTELHGGTMSLTSTPGQGTTIHITFPKERVIG